ncbi:hypothetical protein SAY87_016212 [Trapa incisa]|uniref:PPC domain-containing protein n=2 Tax=Trapa TaxID=22665 RepID=A0AAN7LQD4_TRANT|nr:hypothetical protein SAY87_016212 [Trapa incisa]KAK4785813.1 hypothetical protein SAY86_002502 [Trapa natans]
MTEYGNAMSLSKHPLSSEDSDSDPSPAGVPIFQNLGPPTDQRQLTCTRIQLPAVEDGSARSASAARKPRGRPRGSKNKPKPPLVITRDSESAMKPVVLEISAGSDVIEMVMDFARRRCLGVTLLSGTGTVSNVTLRHTMPTHSHVAVAAAAATVGSLISLHGPFQLLSLWGSFMGFTANPSAATASSGFGITLSGPQGQVFGGVVGGKVVAAGPVTVVAATFLNQQFHRLPPPPSEDHEGESGPDEDEERQAEKKRCESGGYSGEITCTAPISTVPPSC